MVIKDIRRENHCLRATIQWETIAREPFDAYVCCERGDVLYEGHPFLVACVLPAMRHGEMRIQVRNGTVDPYLLDNLRSAIALACTRWEEYESLSIEAETEAHISPSEDRVAASFLTGGVDSLATLRKNRRHIPRSHPKSIDKNILVYGLDLGLGGQVSEEETTSKKKFRETREALKPITESAETELLPVYTNLRHLDDDNDFYTRKWHGSLLTAIAHALSGSIHTALIGSAFDYENLVPWGSTPLMDPLFSGPSLRVEHDGARLTRLEKVQLLASWPEALENVRVCFVNRLGQLNCGRCEKCIRTKVELAAIGELEASEAFQEDRISAGWVNKELQIASPFAAACYEEVVPPLRKQGRQEVARILESKVQSYRAMRRRVEERDWRGMLKRGLRALHFYQ